MNIIFIHHDDIRFVHRKYIEFIDVNISYILSDLYTKKATYIFNLEGLLKI